MEKRNIYTIKLDGEYKPKERSSLGDVEIGNVTICDDHDQDWCEHVYADWSSLEDTDFYDRKFSEIVIEGVENAGFRINGYFIACYNEQNGYYSDDLELIIENKGFTKKIDISGCVKDEIY